MRARTECPTTYWILLRGYIDQQWSDRLEGITISTTCEEGDSFTLLEGRLDDEEASSGVLTILHGIGYSLMSVDSLSG